MKLIDKDALVAEIQKLISNGQVKLQESQESNDHENYIVWSEHIATCIMVLSLIDTLEVKEVDLEKEIELIKGDYEQVDVAWNNDFDFIARHFFELGIQKAQKGE